MAILIIATLIMATHTMVVTGKDITMDIGMVIMLPTIMIMVITHIITDTAKTVRDITAQLQELALMEVLREFPVTEM